MKGEGMDAAWRILPDDMVCACLDETGERRVRRYDHCQRCGAFMAADDDLVLVNVAELRAKVEALPGYPVFADDEYMCPNCVTPWKCNGPHIPDPNVTNGGLIDRAAVLALLDER